MSYYILWNELQKGIGLIFKNIRALLDSASILYENEKYLISASLSILAFEEMTKAELLISHYKNKQAVSENEWKRLTKRRAHMNKLIQFVSQQEIYISAANEVGEGVRKEDLIRMTASFYQMLKEHVFYVNWIIDKKWRWLTEEYPAYVKKLIASRSLIVANRRFEILKNSRHFKIWASTTSTNARAH